MKPLTKTLVPPCENDGVECALNCYQNASKYINSINSRTPGSSARYCHVREVWDGRICNDRFDLTITETANELQATHSISNFKANPAKHPFAITPASTILKSLVDACEHDAMEMQHATQSEAMVCLR
jgi:hypothetical protein